MRLNPILLLDDILCTITNGGGVRIGWLASAAAPAARLLMEHGVKTWGYDMASNPDRRYCMVRRRQAKWAVALLRGLGGFAANLFGVRPRNAGKRKRRTRP